MLNKYIQNLKDTINKVENIQKSDKLIAADFSLHEMLTSIKLKINEVVEAINTGVLKGEPGEKGEKGDPGINGIDGVDGKDGERGPQGYRGEKGEKGDQGEKGDKGDKGDPGIQGIQGIQGQKGDKGDQGIQGENGIDGKNIELQRTTTHIQWRVEGEESWNDLIEIDELRAPALMNIDAYTKEETDALIDNAIAKALEDIGVVLDSYATKEHVNQQIKKVYTTGAVGEDPHPAIYKTAPEMAEDETHYVRCMSESKKYRVYYLKDMARLKGYGSKVNSCQLWSIGSKNKRVFEYDISTDEWIEKTSETYIRVYDATESPMLDSVYSSNVQLLNKAETEEMVPIRIGNPLEAPNNTYNLVNTGSYYVNHSSGIEGCYADAFEGILTIENANNNIYQTLVSIDNTEKLTRIMTNNVWSDWKRETQIPYNQSINTYNYTNADGMVESYNWIDMNGFKIMYIDVTLSEEEYNSGSGGLMMKTLNFPEQAQIFNNIIMANITSYCRADNNTLSRVVQNAEIISNVSVRGRWRHTDNTYPRINNFTILCYGF